MMKKPAKTKAVKCEMCDLEFSESELSEAHQNKAFVFRGKVICEDCLFSMGVVPSDAMTWAAFMASQNQKR